MSIDIRASETWLGVNRDLSDLLRLLESLRGQSARLMGIGLSTPVTDVKERAALAVAERLHNLASWGRDDFREVLGSLPLPPDVSTTMTAIDHQDTE
jgi:hypothetical protein